jgi:ATPase family associated with various cellular activities (AAA)
MTTVSWHDANQHYLMTRLALVREALSRHTARGDAVDVVEDGHPADGTEPMAVTEAASALPAPAALDSLCASFGLSPFERDLLLLCAGMELDSDFGRLCAAAQGDPQRPYPTFSLALAALDEPHWSAIPPAAPLRRWRFIEVGLAEALTTSPLRIDERVLHYLTGASGLDARLQGLVEPLPLHADTPPSHLGLADGIVRLWSQKADTLELPVVNLCGVDHPGKQAVAAAACASAGTALYLLRGADVPTAVAEREALARLWERETALIGCALLLDADDGENTRAVVAFVENVRTALLVATREPLRLGRRQVIRLDVSRPSPAEQRQLWREVLGPLAAQANDHLDTLVGQFSLGAPGIRAASAAARSSVASDGSAGFQALWDACRAQARARLDDLAQRIDPVATWDDLVLPESQRNTLRDITAHVRRRGRVYDEWGFAGQGARGLGISALFAGASGTGKTMAGEVLANDLCLDLYRIDLSQVVSKFIGETEKNLRRVFDAAEEGGAILLFDEADALFGKRTEVKDSHDRYANIEISYLLQRMETYRGLAILTTNIKSVLDTAFTRRLRFIVPFPFPDATQRAAIWRRVFPAATPTENLDPDKLARLNVAGGNIRNIALHAAFLAADTGEPVRMFHLLRAARSEYAKLEKPLSEAEVAQWI